MPWAGDQHTLVVKYCFHNSSESQICTQHAKLGLNRHNPVPDCHIIQCWVNNFLHTRPTKDKNKTRKPVLGLLGLIYLKKETKQSQSVPTTM